jgi:hypothetical protein
MKTGIQLEMKEPLLELMRSCETYCVTACCGADAFEITKEQVGRWVSTQSRERVLEAAAQLQSLIGQVKPGKVYNFWDWFSFQWPPEKCKGWLEEWQRALEAATEG